MQKLPGNIYSGDKELAILTNPTCLAKKKGNVTGDYPIIYKGVKYEDVEDAYKQLSKDIYKDTTLRYLLCENLIFIKLITYPQIQELITEAGGVEFLKECSHWVGFKKDYKNIWEGDGEESGFIRCLISAYRRSLQYAETTRDV